MGLALAKNLNNEGVIDREKAHDCVSLGLVLVARNCSKTNDKVISVEHYPLIIKGAEKRIKLIKTTIKKLEEIKAQAEEEFKRECEKTPENVERLKELAEIAETKKDLIEQLNIRINNIEKEIKPIEEELKKLEEKPKSNK